jgi:adenylate cyclase
VSTPLRLKTQIRLVALISIVVGIAGTFALASYYEGRLYGRELLWRARVIAGELAVNSVEPLLDYDVVKLDTLLESLRTDEAHYADLGYAMILDADGRVVSHSNGYDQYGRIYDDPAAKAALANTDSELVQYLDHGNVLEVSRPVVVSGKRWGTVRVALKLAMFEAEVRAARMHTLLIVIGLALILAILLSNTLRKLFVQPLSEVMRAATEIGQRHFGYRIAHARRDEVGQLYDAFNRMSAMLEDRERVHATFGRYVDAKVRDAILSGAVDPKGKTVHAAILFADLRSFTARSEHLPPDEVLALLNRYCSRMTAAVEAAGGTVDKFIGDAVMAVFGVPLPQEDCALKAVQAARAMVAELEEMNLETTQSEPWKVAIGVHVGPCVAGSVGAPTRMQYTLVGDTVNLASRLLELAKKLDAPVVVSEEVVRACDGKITARPLGEFEIRGRTQQAKVYEVVSLEPVAKTA